MIMFDNLLTTVNASYVIIYYSLMCFHAYLIKKKKLFCSHGNS